MALHKTFLPRDELYSKYIIDGISIDDIAEMYNCSGVAVIRNLNDYNIPRRGAEAKHSQRARAKRFPQNRGDISYEVLYDEYINQHLSIKHIAQNHDCSRGKIKIHLVKHNIVDTVIRPTHKIPKEELEYKYCTLLESVIDISNYYKCSAQTICNWLRKYNIAVRPYKTCKDTPLFRKKMRDGSKFQNIPKEDIYNYYIIEQKSFQEIGDIYGCSHEVIIGLAHRYKIPSRDSKNMHTDRIRQKISISHKAYYRTEEGLELRKRLSILHKNKFEPSINIQKGYTDDFSNSLKVTMRENYDNTCQLCMLTTGVNYNRNMSNHHINHDKELSVPQNIVTLCNRCHFIVGMAIKRKHYEQYFNMLKFNDGIVWKLHKYEYNRVSFN